MKRAVLPFLVVSIAACATGEKTDNYGSGWGKSTATIQGGDHTAAGGPQKPDRFVEGVSLEWTPTDDSGRAHLDARRAFGKKRVQVRPFADAREDRRLIGRNTQERTVKIVNTRDDVGAWCGAQLANVLRDAGVQVVDQDADLIVGGKVTRFLVQEDDFYLGAVTLEVTLVDATGKELASSTVTGEAKRWGRSYAEGNYMETLSDSLLRAFDEFLIRAVP